MRAILVILGVVALLGPASASAQIPGPETYAGDFWTRPRLTGVWGGFRDQLGTRGVTLDVDGLQTYQGVMTGGKAQDSGYWGLVEYTLRFDSQKLGLWPGAFFNVSAMSSYGSTAIKDTGSLVPVNTAGILPGVQPDERATALMELTFLQFLAPWFGVGLGKFNGLGADANAFAWW
jgi:porin